jgi:hypothetical protein
MTGTRLGQVPGVDYWQSRVFNCREFCPLACACFVCTVLRLWPSGGPLEHQPTFLVNRVTHHFSGLARRFKAAPVATACARRERAASWESEGWRESP